MEPVPAVNNTPGPAPNAASIAISASVTTTTVPAILSASSVASSVSRCSSRPAPATPTQIARIGRSVRPAQARWTASRMTDAECQVAPGLIALPGPSAVANSAPWSSTTRTRVLDPPPSTPTKRPFISSHRALGTWKKNGSSHSDDHRNRSADENVPRPCNSRERFKRRCQRWPPVRELPGKHHERHHRDPRRHADECVNLLRTLPEHGQEKPTEEATVRE